MRVNVSFLCPLSPFTGAHSIYSGPRDPEGYWQDRPSGRDGSIERDEEQLISVSKSS